VFNLDFLGIERAHVTDMAACNAASCMTSCVPLPSKSLCSQWESIGPAQAAHFDDWRERSSRINKDVRRTDRWVLRWDGGGSAQRGWDGSLRGEKYLGGPAAISGRS